MFELLVQVVKSSTNLRHDAFLSENHLILEKKQKGRYRVLRSVYDSDGSESTKLIGYTFFEAGYHIFVPFRKWSPAHWYFGLTRCDAISGFLSSQEE